MIALEKKEEHFESSEIVRDIVHLLWLQDFRVHYLPMQIA